ncbi:MAG TPA: BMP family protein [bacterium]|nr:BMP family protein [bacterium]
MRHPVRVIALLFILTALTGAAALPGQGAPAKLRVAMILPGTIQDADFNAVGYVALLALKNTLGVEIAYSEQVAVADAERVAREFIAAGSNVIAFHGGQFLTIVQKLGPAFPNVNFIMESSGRIEGLPPNVWNIGRKFYQGFYTLGVLAALSTQTNVIGYISGVRLPDFVASLNAVKAALREFNPRAQLLYTFVGDQNDPVRARQAAESVIARHADFIIIQVNLGAFGVIEAAKAAPRKVLWTTFYTDKYTLDPSRFAASLLLDFTKPYREVVARIQRGERGGYYEMRPGAGMSLGVIRNVSNETKLRVLQVFNDVVRNTRQIEEITDRILE